MSADTRRPKFRSILCATRTATNGFVGGPKPPPVRWAVPFAQSVCPSLPLLSRRRRLPTPGVDFLPGCILTVGIAHMRFLFEKPDADLAAFVVQFDILLGPLDLAELGWLAQFAVGQLVQFVPRVVLPLGEPPTFVNPICPGLVGFIRGTIPQRCSEQHHKCQQTHVGILQLAAVTITLARPAGFGERRVPNNLSWTIGTRNRSGRPANRMEFTVVARTGNGSRYRPKAVTRVGAPV